MVTYVQALMEVTTTPNMVVNPAYLLDENMSKHRLDHTQKTSAICLAIWTWAANFKFDAKINTIG